MTLQGASHYRLIGAFVAGRLVPRRWPGLLVAATLATWWWSRRRGV